MRLFRRTSYIRNPVYAGIILIFLCLSYCGSNSRYSNPRYISCNSKSECVYYMENRKIKEKEPIAHFSAWDVKYECPIDERGERISTTKNYKYGSYDDFHWVLKLKTKDLELRSEREYQRKSICEKHGKKYIEMMRKGNTKFKF